MPIVKTATERPYFSTSRGCMAASELCVNRTSWSAGLQLARCPLSRIRTAGRAGNGRVCILSASPQTSIARKKNLNLDKFPEA